MASQQGDQSNGSSLAISPALIVGIVIAGAFAVMIVVASTFRYCRQSGPSTVDSDDEGGAGIFNPNRPRSATQVARMKEVRWINNMYAWERGRQAKIEIGEARPTTMLLGKPGQNRNWDEWSVADNSPGRNSHQSENTAAGESAGATYLYNMDDPYGSTCSSPLKRLSHLAPPVEARRSNQAHGDAQLRQSVLLPQPIQRDQLQRSPLRHEYQGVEAEAPKLADSTATADNSTPPKITINDGSEDIADLRPSAASASRGAGFESLTLALRRGPTDMASHSRVRPHIDISWTDERFPQLQALPTLQFQSAAGFCDDKENINDQDDTTNMNAMSDIELGHEHEHEDGNEQTTAQDSVKGMIQEWENVNGRFARTY